MSVYAGPEIVNSNLYFHVDFSNSKSINTSNLSLTDLGPNKISISLTNASNNSLFISANGYAEFIPSDLSNTATFYTIANTGFNSIKNEMTLETCLYVYGNFGNFQYVRGVSPRTTETSSPLGFSVTSSGITCEVNTSAGWKTAIYSNSSGGYNKWVHILQTTSVSANTTKTYLNGVEVGSIDLAGAIPNGGNGLLIGRGFYGGVTNYYGRVSFVKVYDKALNLDEILQNFNALRGRFGL